MNRTWRRTALLQSILLLAAAFTGAQEDNDANTPKLERFRKAIGAYEDLFTRSRIVWTEGPGASQEATVVLSGIDTERIVDGPSAYIRMIGHRKGGNETNNNTAVTDGTTCRLLNSSEGSTTCVISRATEEALVRFQNYLFQPHRGYGFVDADRVEILSDDGKDVHLRYHREHTYMDAEYTWFGEYLRLNRYQSGSKSTQALVAGTEYCYQYNEKAHGDARLAPAQIEQISRLHGIHGIYNIKEVDFDPRIPEGQFELTFPEGAYIRDERTEPPR